MADLTADQIEAIRRGYIRDLVVGPTPGPAEALSAYNVVTGREYLSDADLESIFDVQTTVYREELDAVWESKYAERVSLGDSDVDATAAADAVRLSAVYRLIRADAFERMMMDPNWVSAVPEISRQSLFATWRSQIVADRQFTRSQGGGFASLPLYRA